MITADQARFDVDRGRKDLRFWISEVESRIEQAVADHKYRTGMPINWDPSLTTKIKRKIRKLGFSVIEEEGTWLSISWKPRGKK